VVLVDKYCSRVAYFTLSEAIAPSKNNGEGGGDNGEGGG